MTYEERLALAIGQTRTNEDDEAIASIVREHATFVYRVAYSVLRDSHDAEDVVQETFIRVLKNVPKLPSIRDQRAWLARVAWRLALTRWSRAKTKRRHEVDRFDRTDVAVLSSFESDAAVATIEKLTASLPEHLRHPLMLSAIEEMSAKEVAQILNISEPTVRTRIHRARKLLREKLGN